MEQDKSECGHSSFYSSTSGVLFRQPTVIRVRKFSGNKKPTNGKKPNKIIRVRIKSSTKIAPNHFTNGLLSPLSGVISLHEKSERSKSYTLQNSDYDSARRNTRSNKINSGNESYGTLNEIKTDGAVKKGSYFKLPRLRKFALVLALFITAIIAGIITGTVITLKMTTTTTTTSTTIITTNQTTVPSTTTKSATLLSTTTTTSATATTVTTTTETTVTPSTVTTTTTTRPVICPSAFWYPNGTTVARSSSGTYGSGPLLLNQAYDVRVDSALNIYVADYNNFRFMKWVPNCTNEIVFGPQSGYGPAYDTNHLNTATTLCFDSSESNVYLSDTFNCRILKMNIATGNITTVILVLDVVMLTTKSLGVMDFMSIVRFDNLYVADWNNDRVLKVPPNTNLSTNGVIVAGTGSAGSSSNQLNTPWNIYVDETDNDALYIADYKNHRVVKWYPNATNGTVVAGGNGAGSLYTQLNFPQAVYVDSFGSVYVADYGNHRIMRWLKGATSGTLVAGIAGSPGTASTQLDNPSGIFFDKNGDMYVSEYSNNRVQRFTVNNTSC